MAMYITLSEGPRADLAAPILATGDQRIVQAVLQALARIARETSPAPDAPVSARVGARNRTKKESNIYQLSKGESADED